MNWMQCLSLSLSEQRGFGAERVATERFFAALAVGSVVLAFCMFGVAAIAVALIVIVAFVVRSCAAGGASVLRRGIAAVDSAQRADRSASRGIIFCTISFSFSALRAFCAASLLAAERIYGDVLLAHVALAPRQLPTPRASRRGALLR
ncbi:hypothetical protein [Propionivibrio limicola]|uniref:hypothetical protein n=1 Tax=Propionivibrio limicola TaxID=167645 RepID=UPI001292A6F2|nr:hypothetical protein [Propionivibrio limicola]